MRRLVAAAALAAVIVPSPGSAQPVSVDQIAPRAQAGQSVQQIPGSLVERRAPTTDAMDTTAGEPMTESKALAAPARKASRDSVDADAVARLLGAGQAASIDAAAAIATGAAPQQKSGSDDPALAELRETGESPAPR